MRYLHICTVLENLLEPHVEQSICLIQNQALYVCQLSCQAMRLQQVYHTTWRCHEHIGSVLSQQPNVPVH